LIDVFDDDILSYNYVICFCCCWSFCEMSISFYWASRIARFVSVYSCFWLFSWWRRSSFSCFSN